MNRIMQNITKTQVSEIKLSIADVKDRATMQFSPETCVLNDNNDHWLNSKIIFGIDCRRWLCGFCGKPFEN